MSDSYPNGDSTPDSSAPENGEGFLHPDITHRMNQLQSELAHLQQDLSPEESNGDRVHNAAGHLENGQLTSKPVREMRPPESQGDTSNTVPELVTMKVKVPCPTPTTPCLGSNPDLLTMKVKVPRSNPLDPPSMGKAIAESLHALSQSTPDVVAESADVAGASNGREVHPPIQSELLGPRVEEGEEFVPDEAPQIGRELTLRDVFFMVRERWVVGAAVGLTLAAGFAYWMLNKTPVYRSTAELQIRLKSSNVLPIEGMEESVGSGTIDSAMEVHRKTLLSDSYSTFLLDRFLTEEDGTSSPLKQAYVDGLMKFVDIEPHQHSDATRRDRLFDQHFRRAKSLSVTRRSSQPFLEISYHHPIPEVARSMANTVINAYDDYLKENVKEDLDDAKAYIGNEVKALKAKIKEAEREIQLHRQRHNLFQTGGGETSRASSVADSLEKRIQDTEVKIVAAMSQLELIKLYDRKDVEQLSQQSFISEFGPVKAVQEELNANRQEFAQLDIRYGAKWPAVIANRTANKNLLAQLDKNVKMAIKAIENSLKKMEEEQLRLRQNQKVAEEQSLGVNDPVVLLKEMQSILELDKKSIETVQNRLNEFEISVKLERTKVDVMQDAILPYRPVYPNRNRIMQVACLIFVSTFLGLPIGLGFLDNRLKSFSEAEAFLGKECLGVIPERLRLETVDLGQAVLKNKDEQIVESFRVILGSIDLSSRVPCPKVWITTSAGPGEGKSFVTANLAAMLARHGKRCLIVDCDLRKPSQHKLVDTSNEHGLMHWLQAGARVLSSAEAALSDPSLGVLQLSQDGNLCLLRAGGSTRSPSELITTYNFESLLGVLKNAFDIILIDSPPVGLFPDALFLAGYADESLFVCKHNGLHRHKIKYGLRKMERCHCGVMGVVMNQLSTSRRHQYGFGYRDYDYGYYSSNEYARYYAEDDDASSGQA